MARDLGFARADIATGHYDDDRVRKLVRLLDGDSAAICEALTIHMAAVLASWGAGRRQTVEEASPLWLRARPELVTALQSAGLLDATERVPVRSWKRHHDPAVARRKARQDAGRLGGTAPRKPRSSNAQAELNPSNQPTIHPSKGAPTRRRRRKTGAASGPMSLADALAGTPFGDAMAARGETK